MTKQSFTASGVTPSIVGTKVLYYANFDTPGAGTVQLQIKIDDDWLPADTSQSSTMLSVELAETEGRKEWRLNVGHTSGTIITYLEVYS